MAFRKNTAQAFEILRQIHAEEKERGESARRRAQSSSESSPPGLQPGPVQGSGAEAPAANQGSPLRDARAAARAAEKRPTRVGRQPLLKAERSPLDERLAGRRRELLRNEKPLDQAHGMSLESGTESSRPVPESAVPKGAGRGGAVPGGTVPRDRAGGRGESSSLLHRWLNDQKEAQEASAEREAARERRELLAGSLGDREGFVRKPTVDPVLERSVREKREEPGHRRDARTVGLLTPTEPGGARRALEEDSLSDNSLDEGSREEPGAGDGAPPEPLAQHSPGATRRGGRQGTPGRSGPSGPSKPDPRPRRGQAPGKGTGKRSTGTGKGRAAARVERDERDDERVPPGNHLHDVQEEPEAAVPVPAQERAPETGSGREAERAALVQRPGVAESAREVAVGGQVVVRGRGVAGALHRLAGWARTAVEWSLGEGSTRWLGRRVELKLSSLIVFALVGVVLVTLFLTWLRLPGETDPHFLQPPAGWAEAEPVAQGAQGAAVGVSGKGLAADGSSATSPPRLPASLLPAPALTGSPVWSPGTAPAPPPPPPADPPAISEPPAPAASVSEPSAVPAEPREYIYRIQVRAHESFAGAERIFDYLDLFGFRETLAKEENRKRGGQPLYTVFVGKYPSLKEANRECVRLKEETSETPYKGQRDFFQDCYVHQRRR